MITKRQWITVVEKIRNLRMLGYHPTFHGIEVHAAYFHEIVVVSNHVPTTGAVLSGRRQGSGLWLVDHSSLTRRNLGFKEVLDQIAVTIRFSDLKCFDLTTKEPVNVNQRERAIQECPRRY